MGDGLTNMEKYVLMLDPTKAEAGGIPGVTVTYNAQGLPALSFPTMRDRTYAVLYSTSPGSAGTWTQAGNALIGTGSKMTWTDNGSLTGGSPSASKHRFYKVLIGVQ